MGAIDAEFLALLVCPESHARLAQVGEWLYSTDPATRRRYPIRDGIPILLIDEAETADETEWNHAVRSAGEKMEKLNENAG